MGYKSDVWSSNMADETNVYIYIIDSFLHKFTFFDRPPPPKN